MHRLKTGWFHRIAGTALLWLGCQAVFGADASQPVEPGTVKWTFATGGKIFTCPAIGDDGTVYVSSSDGRLYALNGQTGAQQWMYDSGGSGGNSPAIGNDGTVYHSCSRYLDAFDGTTGAAKWRFQFKDSSRSSPAIGPDGTVFVGSNDERLYALDGATGLKKWEFEAGDEVDSSPAILSDGIGGGTVFFSAATSRPDVSGTAYGRRLFAIDAKTGVQTWTAGGMAGDVSYSPTMGTGGNVYLPQIFSRRLGARDAATGSYRWGALDASDIFRVRSPVSVGENGLVYSVAEMTDYRNRLFALDPADGSVRWTLALGQSRRDYVGTPSVAQDNTVYVPGEGLYAVDGSDGRILWTALLLPSGGVASPNIGRDGTVYVGCGNHNIYAIAGTSPLASQNWPCERGNRRNSGILGHPPEVAGQPRSRVVQEGSAWRGAADVRGFPKPTVRWYKNDSIVSRSEKYMIVHVTAADEGDYFFTLTNFMGTTTSRYFAILVSNVEPVDQVGISFNGAEGTTFDLEYTSHLNAPDWRVLSRVTMGDTGYVFLDPSASHEASRFYRTTGGQALRMGLFHSWTLPGAAGKTLRIDYVDANHIEAGWQVLTELVLPASPWQFVDLSSPQNVRRFYRTREEP